MPLRRRFLITEVDGTNLRDPKEHIPQAEDIQFSASGTPMTATNLQDAVLEAGIKIINITFPGGQSVSAAQYTAVASFIFPGTSKQIAPTYMKAILRNAGTSVSCRVYDVTNQQVISEAAGVTSDATSVVSLSAPINLPENEAIFEIQISQAGILTQGWIYALQMGS